MDDQIVVQPHLAREALSRFGRVYDMSNGALQQFVKTLPLHFNGMTAVSFTLAGEWKQTSSLRSPPFWAMM